MDKSEYWDEHGKLKRGHPGDLSPGRRGNQDWSFARRKAWAEYLRWIKEYSEGKGVASLPSSARSLLIASRAIFEKLVILESEPMTDNRAKMISQMANSLEKVLRSARKVVVEDRKKYVYEVIEDEG
jgi:hypothetical protein